MNNGNVAHNFVYSDNGNGSNFESINGTLYSYSSILAIKKNGLIFICDHIANYSSSSQRHALHLNRAIGWNTPQRENTIDIYDDIQAITRSEQYVKKAVLVEIGIAVDKIKALLLKQSRARKYNYFTEIENVIENANKIIKYLGIDKRSVIYKSFVKYSDIEDLKENYKDLIANYAKEKKAAQQKEINAQHKKVYDKIQSFTGMSKTEMKQYSKKDLATFDFLVIKDNKDLCTSQRLCVDLAAAKTLYKAMIKGKNINGLKIGHYTILGHSGKSVKIGCHNILKAELKRVLDEN